MVEELYRLQGFDGNINQTVAKFFADKLWAGVVKGYGSDMDNLDFESPDYKMLAALKENVWQFSAAANYQQLRELTDALLDENGMLKTFAAFEEAARAINEKYLKHRLKVEYNLAINGAQMAGKWVSITENAGVLPLLQFDAVIDSQSTDICKGLNGTILPITHSFWNKFYPPNHFNCRSTVRQLANVVETPEHKIPSAVIPDMFQTNLGKQGLIFPEDHPYFIGLPIEVKNQLSRGT